MEVSLHIVPTIYCHWNNSTNYSWQEWLIPFQIPEIIDEIAFNNEKIKSVYGTDVDGILIFDFDKLCSLLKYREYWANSFTKYRNKIGLTSSGKYIADSTDIVLDFPFKDCLLEGGMTKEEQGKDEVYYNEIIARDEIDNLLSPKALVNVSRHTKDGEVKNIHSFHEKDNLIIKGNNLIALHSLLGKFTGKVKLIYIDPPYNTGSDTRVCFNITITPLTKETIPLKSSYTCHYNTNILGSACIFLKNVSKPDILHQNHDFFRSIGIIKLFLWIISYKWRMFF